MSSLVTARGVPDPQFADAATEPRPRSRRLAGDTLSGAGLGAILSAIAFLTTGGTDLAPNTWVQIALTVIAAGLAAGVLAVGAPGRRFGAVTMTLFAALAALTFASIAWSVEPQSSWLEANRTLSYLAVFGAGVALARLFPERWPTLVGGVAAFATVVCTWALLVKVFPASLDAGDQLGRLGAPFGYWNAAGLAAAMGLPACLWAGARREGGRVVRAFSIPAMSALLTVLVLSQSRGALLAAAVGAGLWIALASVRLRAVLLLAVAAAGAAAVSLWAVAQNAITHDGSTLPARAAAGHDFGLVLLGALTVLTIAGAGISVAMERVALAPRVRRVIATALVALLALVPVLGVVGLATSARGLTGQISHAWSTLTDQNSVVFDTPGRLAQLSNSRPRYWSEGIKVGEHAPLAGTGALGYGTARTRYAKDALVVQHAHSYVIETFADFGLIGVALSVALAVSWLLDIRALGLSGGAARRRDAERGGIVALLAVAVTFGLHSLIDWTWFIPGVAVPAMLCAGWLSGRGALSTPVGRAATSSRLLESPARGAAATGLIALAALAAWVIWQPLHAADAETAAGNAMLAGHPAAAISDARTAASSDPVAVDPLWELSAFYSAVGATGAARRELTEAVARQPSNPVTWEMLGQFDLQHRRRTDAVREARRALALDPRAKAAQQLAAQAGVAGA